MILPATKDDIPPIVQVHLESFPGFFLTFLGPRFLALFYGGVRDEQTGCFYVFKDDGGVKGFVCGTSNPSGFFRRLLRRQWFKFACASLAAVAKRPVILPRLTRTLAYPSHATSGDSCATLMSIAVSPSASAKGIGQALVRAFLDEMRKRGIKTVDLTTDRHNNDRVNAFYVALGFRLKRAFSTREGRQMNEYIIEL